MLPTRPSHDLMRIVTDEHVVRALIDEPQLTRAELAARTGISKPTASESVRRLTEAGLIQDTGERTTGRGRIGTYYALADDIGSAMVLGIAPEGVTAEIVTVRGEVVATSHRSVHRPARPREVTRAMKAAAHHVVKTHPGSIRVAVVSAADPVDRATGRLVHLPDAPFLIGELSPVDALSALVDGPIVVDNDVNWAARAEQGLTDGLRDFAYVYLGEGVGCAIVCDGEVRRGHSGIAGELAHILTTGPDGRAVPFTDVFAQLGLQRKPSTAIAVEELLQAVDGDDAGAARILAGLGQAISAVLAAIVALTDPELVVIGGTWGTHPKVLAAIEGASATLPRHVPLHPAVINDQAPLAGARRDAVHQLRSIVAAQIRQL